MTSLAPTVGTASTHPSDMPKDHADLPVWNAENWFYEDWPVGQKIRSLRRTMAEGDSHLFNALVLDIHPYVQDQMFAEREGIFGKRLVAGAFVFSAGLGLVATNCVNAFSYGYDRLRFIKPVFIGDTITVTAEITAKADHKRMPETHGYVHELVTVTNQRAETVLVLTHLYLVDKRGPA